MKEIQEWSDRIKKSVGTVFFGKDEVIEKILVGILCKGHILLEDVPGVGKTILARAIALSLGGKFKRIQCTSDLLPSDIIGVSIFKPNEGVFHFKKGPIHGNIVLVDEINRATPRTQSALLEAMAEGQVSIEGSRMLLPDPFFIMATENPVEFEGTFPLPEAQKDRFLMSLNIGYPSVDAEKAMLENQNRMTHPVNDLTAVSSLEELKKLQEMIPQVHIEEKLRDYILETVRQTREKQEFQLGVSPRGSLSLFKASQALAAINGRDYVVPEDIKELILPIFSQRIILKNEYVMKGYTAKDILKDLLETIDLPVSRDLA